MYVVTQFLGRPMTKSYDDSKLYISTILINCRKQGTNPFYTRVILFMFCVVSITLKEAPKTNVLT